MYISVLLSLLHRTIPFAVHLKLPNAEIYHYYSQWRNMVSHFIGSLANRQY